MNNMNGANYWKKAKMAGHTRKANMTKSEKEEADVSEVKERAVSCPVSGEKHEVIGPKGTRSPSREIVEQWVENSPR